MHLASVLFEHFNNIKIYTWAEPTRDPSNFSRTTYTIVYVIIICEASGIRAHKFVTKCGIGQRAAVIHSTASIRHIINKTLEMLLVLRITNNRKIIVIGNSIIKVMGKSIQSNKVCYHHSLLIKGFTRKVLIKPLRIINMLHWPKTKTIAGLLEE